VDFTPLAREIDAAIGAGAFPGAVVLVSRRGRVLYHQAFGARSLEPERTPMHTDTTFDLSSLTKPLATTTAFMLLVQERKVQLDDRVSRFFPNFGVHGKTHVTFRHLLAHCSGLTAWRPFFKEIVRIEKKGRVNFVASRVRRSGSTSRSTASGPSTSSARRAYTATSASCSSAS
jgi:CubicO group peptidase (beta-lactamase class C family)